MEEYNVKIKKHNEQSVISIYSNSIKERELVDNIIIQLKKYRTQNSDLLFVVDSENACYYTDDLYLDAELKMMLFDNDLDDSGEVYRLIRRLVPNCYYSRLKNDSDKEQRSINTSLSRTKKKVYDLAYSNSWSHFVTLTFDDTVLMKKYGKTATDYDTCVSVLHSFFTVLKRQCPNVAYIGVPELHHSFYDGLDIVIFNNKEFKDSDLEYLLNKQNRTNSENEIVQKCLDGTYKRRFHFHFLFNNYPSSKLTDSGLKTKKGQTIYNLLNFKYGFTTATEIESVQASQYYITKYITKDLVCVSQGKRRYWCSKNLKRPLEYELLMDNDELKDFKNELETSVKSDTRKKKIEVQNDDFSNVIFTYVIKDFELYNNSNLKEYCECDVNVIKIPDYFINPSEYANLLSPFNPFNNYDFGYCEHWGTIYKFNRINNIVKLSTTI